MKKNILFTIIVMLIFGSSFAQLKVLSNYTVEMTNGRLSFKTSNPGIEIGAIDQYNSANTVITFWHSTSSWNQLKALKFLSSSDENLKTDIKPIENASKILGKIKTYSYSYKDNPELKGYGVIAQEFEEVIPELVDNTKDVKGVSYIELIPFLISGFQEKSERLEKIEMELDVLKEENLKLRNTLEELLSLMGKEMPSEKSKGNNKEEAFLYQNSPNPFNQQTEIRFFVPVNAKSALLQICDMQGKELKSYHISNRGENTCKIIASDLQAGMYYYTLIVDNKPVDTKRLVLTK